MQANRFSLEGFLHVCRSGTRRASHPGISRHSGVGLAGCTPMFADRSSVCSSHMGNILSN